MNANTYLFYAFRRLAMTSINVPYKFCVAADEDEIKVQEGGIHDGQRYVTSWGETVVPTKPPIKRDKDFLGTGRKGITVRKGDGWYGVLDPQWRETLEARRLRLVNPEERHFIEMVLAEHYLRSAKSDVVEQSCLSLGLKHVNLSMKPPKRFEDFQDVDFFRCYAREGGRTYRRTPFEVVQTLVEMARYSSRKKVTVQNFGTPCENAQGITKTSYIKCRLIPEDKKTAEELGWEEKETEKEDMQPIHILDLMDAAEKFSAYERKSSRWNSELSELGTYQTRKSVPVNAPLRQIFSYDRQLGDIVRSKFDLSKIAFEVNYKEGSMKSYAVKVSYTV